MLEVVDQFQEHSVICLLLLKRGEKLAAAQPEVLYFLSGTDPEGSKYTLELFFSC